MTASGASARAVLQGTGEVGTVITRLMMWGGSEPMTDAGLFSSAARTTGFTATCPLPPRFDSVRLAREFTAHVLDTWGLGDLLDSLGLVVSELVTNALVHALPYRTDGPSGGSCSASSSIRLGLVHEVGYTACAVADPSDRPPRMHVPEPLVCECVSSSQPCPHDLAGTCLGGLSQSFDEEPTAPRVAEHGRGLYLVESFSDAWGWSPLVASGHVLGKAVWASFRIA